jgi:branched-chain amino acid transport system substrate-binding protein
MRKQLDSRINRRDALKTIGMASALLAARPLASIASVGGSLAPIRTREMNVGVLLPFMSSAPAAKSLLAGMQLYLDRTGAKAGGRSIRLIAEDTGRGIGETVARARKLVERDNTDLIVGLVNPAATQCLHDLFAKNRGVFLEVNAGERIADRRDVSPQIFRNTLSYWEASHAMGMWAARNIGRRTVIASSFRESGYDAIRAFRRGFEIAGGTVVDLCVTGAPQAPETPAEIMKKIAAAAPDFVCALYAQGEACEFIDAYDRAGFAGRLPLVGSGFMTSEGLLGELGGSALGIMSGFSWSEQLRNDANEEFVAAYRRATGNRADAFALLGYESAQIMAQAIELADGSTRRSSRLAAAFRKVEIAGPRGTVAFNRGTQSITPSLYVREVRNSGGTLSNTIIARLDNISPTERIQLANLDTNRGWLNPYLAV